MGLGGCGLVRPEANATPPQEITVFAASSLTEAFQEAAKAFEAQHPDIRVALNFAGSSQLAAQLSEGIPADVFASANEAQMQAGIDMGRIQAGAEANFVSNRLAVIVPVDNPANLFALEDLAKPGVKLILAVEGVPVRDYTDQIVGRMPTDFQASFYANLVSEEDNVRQVAAKVALGEADAGIVYTSDVTPEIANRVLQIAVPDAQNVVAVYPIAPLADAPHPAAAQEFINFILSPEGQMILLRWGFNPPPGI
ncbi:MAG: molybdate ABC transporter substrate-binding protein [Chloroflexi bacterium]|nr:molybdate ABC transporter substrate-binding protein [Chloroflexota bacterium]MBP7044543.1 molybdate ABC transporter substrate-binding protein [Chloroflexota bacterium]